MLASEVERLAGSLAIGQLTDYRDVSDPTYVGPGTWNTIHRLAYAATTLDLQNDFVTTMEEICRTFPCPHCQGHCKQYMIDNPIRKFIGLPVMVNGGEQELGMFLWTFLFHNAVTARVGKNKMMAWETALALYSKVADPNECSKVCKAVDDQHDPVSKTDKLVEPAPLSNQENVAKIDPRVSPSSIPAKQSVTALPSTRGPIRMMR